jgi:arginine/lysine/ornithine decarboxylase
VFVTSPSYYGVTPDVARLAEICHTAGKPLVVDEAWGPHFPFHPEMPRPAIQCGADMSVGSIHKTMAGLEQASFMLLNSRIVPADRFNNCFDLFETTSPSGPILASIDATRRQFAQSGEKLIGDTLQLTRRAREAIAGIDGIRVMGREILDGDARHAMDETKVLLDISDLGITGYEAEDWMMRERKLSLGLSDERHLLVIFTVGSDEKSTDELLSVMRELPKWAETQGVAARLARGLPRRAELKAEFAMSPAEAFYAPSDRVPLESAAGRIAAEMLSPYPPGIPRVVPGQRITPAQVDFLRIGMEIGAFPLDASDVDLKTVRVVA